MKYVYKIVAALLALAIIPMFIFTPIASVRFESIAVKILSYYGQVKGNESIGEIVNEGGELPSHIAERFSVYDIALGEANTVAGSISDIVKNYGENEYSLDLSKLVAPAVAIVVLMILASVCALLAAIFAIFAKDNRKVIYSSIAGVGFTCMIPATFKAIAQPFLDQEISFAALTESILGSLIGKVTDFQISSTFWLLPAMFVIIVIWTVLYNYTLPEKEKTERKLMLGEAD